MNRHNENRTDLRKKTADARLVEIQTIRESDEVLLAKIEGLTTLLSACNFDHEPNAISECKLRPVLTHNEAMKVKVKLFSLINKL